MERETTIATLSALGLDSPASAVSEIEEGATSLLRTAEGIQIALLRHNEKFDTLILGTQPDCPVPSLRAVLETAVLPLSDTYAANVGVAVPERDAVRKRIREASVALDVIAKGRHFSVPPPEMLIHTKVRRYVKEGGSRGGQLPEDLYQDLELLNQLHANVIAWSREIDRIVNVVKSGPEAVLSVEEETVFWSSLDAAFVSAQTKLASEEVRITLEILARNRRATGFLQDVSNMIDTARRKAAAALNLVQGLPIVALRTADDLQTLKEGVTALLIHVAGKLKVSVFSIQRVLSLVDSMGEDVSRSIERILTRCGGLLSIPFDKFREAFQDCCDIFESWFSGFDHCRKVGREAARKRGENMPPRQISPLSHLHAHLTNVFELRSDHEALRTVFKELSKCAPSAQVTVNHLDQSYAALTKDSETFDHFNLRLVIGTLWTHVSTSYRDRFSKAEASASAAYQDVVQNEPNIASLSKSLRPFRNILGKHFMVSVVNDAVPFVLTLGRHEFGALRTREAFIKESRFVMRGGDVPPVCVALAEYQVLQHRAASLVNFIEECVGKTQVEVSLELKEFIADVERLQERIDPSVYLSNWLGRVNLDAYNSNIFTVAKHGDRIRSLKMTVDPEEAVFYKVVQLARENAKLAAFLSAKHLEFSRTCKVYFPLYCNLRDAILCLNTFDQQLSRLDELTAQRALPLFVRKRKKVQKLFEESIQIRWTEPSAKLLLHSSKLYSESSVLVNDLQFFLEMETEIESAVRDLDVISPCFNRGRLSEETTSLLRKSIQRVIGAVGSSRPLTFEDGALGKHLETHWSALLKEALASLMSRIFRSWTHALRSNSLSLPAVVISLLRQDPSRPSLSCQPSVCEIERQMYVSLGDASAAFVETLKGFSCEVEFDAERSNHNSIENMLMTLIDEYDFGSMCNEYVSSLAAIHEVLEHLVIATNCWSTYAGFGDPGMFDLAFQVDNRFEEVSEVLEILTKAHEDVSNFSHECDIGGRGQNLLKSSLEIDVTVLSRHILVNIFEVLDKVCDKCSVKAAEVSQRVYESLANAKATIRDASGVSTIEMLMSLENVRDNVLPFCEKSATILFSLEKKFQEVAQRMGNDSFSRAHRSETWILSEELMANLQGLKELYGQRRTSLLVNKDILERKYQERERAYQDDLSLLFAELQIIRGDNSSNESSFDSNLALVELEGKLRTLNAEGLDLDRLGKALGMPSLLDKNSPGNILIEVRKLESGIQELKTLNDKIFQASQARLRDVDPVSIRNMLMQFADQANDISTSTGAKREGNQLRSKITNLLKANILLSRVHSIKLSAKRERDVMHHLFGHSGMEGGIGAMTLEALWDANLETHAKYLHGVFENAAGEAAISEYLCEVERTWLCRKYSFVSQHGTIVVRGIQVLLDELDEHIQGLETMRGSAHARLFESDRANWEQRLANCRQCLELLAEVQSRWSHLSTLFGIGNSRAATGLRDELREEFGMFSNVHARFANLGRRLQRAPGLLEGFDTPSGLDDMSKELASIVRGLSAYLENQRTLFPRFFFLSDSDLLHVLSTSSSECEGIVPYIGKIFPGLSSINIEEKHGAYAIRSIVSKEGELVTLENSIVVSTNEPTSSWLHRLQGELVRTLRGLLVPAITMISTWYNGTALEESISTWGELGLQGNLSTKFPAQIALLAMKVCFTSAVEQCLSEKESVVERLKRLLAAVEDVLTKQRSAKNSQTCKENRALNLHRDQFIKELFYQKQLLIHFQKNKVRRLSSPYWTRELRFYISDGQEKAQTDITVQCGQARFSYGWEYLGIGETLVQTPLTSRCYLTLAEALRQGLGGSPFGPAGTGKTETVKALGRHLGRFVAVFNCDESFDSIAVGRILAGACRIGCWVCFDEFNRLSASILSSTSGQLVSLQLSIRKGSSVVSNFYGGNVPISVDKGVGVFVTMNPTYSGRRELPANLKSLFRPCAMSTPDIFIIVEVLFLSHGFRSSSALSKKLVSLFQNLRSIVSSAPHYDFGLRSLKSAISASGSLLCSTPNAQGRVDDSFEEDILIRALDEVVKPKLDASDVKAYNSSVKVIFTKATCFTSSLPNGVEEAVRRVMREKNLIFEPEFFEKITQLYSLLHHQSGIMLVGPTGSGKSIVWRTLYVALKRLLEDKEAHPPSGRQGQVRASLTVLDPKLLTTRQLYGELDAGTREWSDGLFTKILRNLSAATIYNAEFSEHNLHWIVFDGDVDPDWVENLNSVLDDNKILTLPNGEHIPLLKNTRIIFETDNLAHANPSTVSRCGMVCFGNRYRTQAFVNALKSLIIEIEPSFAFPICFEDIATTVLQVTREVIENKKLIMYVPAQSILDSILRILRSTLRIFTQASQGDSESIDGLSAPSDHILLSKDTFIYLLVIASVKSISAGLDRHEQIYVSQKIMSKLKNLDDVWECFNGFQEYENYAEVTLTTSGLMEFSELLPNNKTLFNSQDVGSPDIVIPTPTTVRLESLFREILDFEAPDWNNVSPLVLCGPPGCGKSMLLTAALRNIPNISLATLSFSSETSPDNILATLRGHMTLSERANGTLSLRPRAVGYRVILFCDEVNLEKPDSYGTQHTIALLRSVVEHQGFWQGNPPRWVSVSGMQIVAACNPEGDAGRHKLPLRFLKHCTVVRVEQPNEKDLGVIYKAFVDSMLRSVHLEISPKADGLTSAMIEFFSFNTNRFCPKREGPLEPHYVYSPRDLSRWIRGMQQLLPCDQMSALSNSLTENASAALWSDIVFAFCYEARRIFSDRLIRQAERNFVEEKLQAVMNAHLDLNMALLGDFFYTSWIENEEATGNFPRRFRIVHDLEQFRTLIYRKLRVFAEEEGLGGSWMVAGGMSGYDDSHAMIDQFAVTDDVLAHLTRLERIFCQPLGHAVLMGAPGTGKKTLARFAAWMLSMDVHQVYSHSSYSEADFANDLRLTLRKAGVNNCHVMMIFDESNALDSAFLEMMNSILACGDVPGLFFGDERTRLLEELKQRSASGGCSIENEQVMYAEFVKHVRRNLHIVFTISTGCSENPTTSDSGQKARVTTDILERSPALYNRCTVDWIGDWNKQTLEAVAELKTEVFLSQEKEQIIRSAVRMHEVAREYLEQAGISPGVTPRHYLEFIEQLNRIALEKGNEIQSSVDRYTEGLQRLRNAGNAIDDLKEELGEKADRLQLKEKHAGETLQRMVEEQRLAEKSKVSAEQLALAAKEASAKAHEREQEVSYQLAEVQPKIEAARTAVGLIRKEFLEELRAMPNPPSGVRIALDGVMMLLDAGSHGRIAEMQYSWSSTRSRMRSTDFITSVVNFDAESLPKGMRSRVEKKILRNPDFDIARISYASRVAGPLAEWTMSVLDYATVKEATEPLQEEIQALQEEQEELLEQQEDALRQVSEFEERIEICRSRYAALVSEAERVRQEIQDARKNLQRSEDMLDSLAEEWDRWVKELNAFNAAAVAVWGNSVCGAAFIAYAGPLDHVTRSCMFEEWKNILKCEAIPFEENLEVCDFLTSPGERGLWSTLGLPTDPTSLENYAIMKRSARFPLIIDPSRNSTTLIRKVLAQMVHSIDDDTEQRGELIGPPITESSFSLKGKKSYMRTLESAMRFGTTIVIEDAEKFDRAVAPLLGQESSYGGSSAESDTASSKKSGVDSLVARGEKARKGVSQRVVRLGDRDVSLSSGFRLFLATTNIDPVPPAAISRSNVVSFELSPAALKSTCVTRAMQILSPNLEERRKASLAAKLNYEERKRSLEEDVLAAITNVEDLGAELLKGPLLDNLISLKSEVERLEEKQTEELHASREILKIEESLGALGETAVDIFGVLQSLSAMHPLYSFHIPFFLDLFETAIKTCKQTDVAPELDRVHECQRSIIQYSYSFVEASLFPRDKLPFAAALSLISMCSLHLGSREQMYDDDVQMVYSSLRIALNNMNEKGALTAERKREALSIFPDRLRMLFNIVQIDKHDRLNSPSNSALSVVRCALEMPHRMTAAIDRLACALPGDGEIIHGRQTGSEAALLSSLRKFSAFGANGTTSTDSSYSPLLLCARGDNLDVASLVNDYSSQFNVSVSSFAMGNSQTPDWLMSVFSEAIREAGDRKKRVLLLKNAHLASKSTLERLRSEVTKRNGRLPFLLVIAIQLSAQYSGDYFVRIVSLCRMLAFEARPTFRANLQSAVNKVSTACFHHYSPSDHEDSLIFKKLEVVSAWLHSCLLERALFSPVGFSKPYQFSEADLIASWNVATLSFSTSKDHEDSITDIGNMLADSIYGCRIEENTDLDIVRALVQSLFNSYIFVPDSSECVSVFSSEGTTDAVIVPLLEKGRSEYIRSLPLHAPPEWSFMPSDTTTHRQVMEGKMALEKIITLLDGKFQRNGDKSENAAATGGAVSSTQNLQTLKNCETTLSNLGAIVMRSPSLDPLHLYVETESNSLTQLIGVILDDLRSILGLAESMTTRNGVKLRDLEKELILNDGLQRVPHTWGKACAAFSRNLSVEEFVSKLKKGVEGLRDLAQDETSTINISLVLRPAALLEALKFSESGRRQISPYNLRLRVLGDCDGKVQCRRLCGVQLRGGRWDGEKQIFIADGKATEDKLHMMWDEVKDEDECGDGIVELPWYDSSIERRKLVMVRISVKDTSLERWRLNGACMCMI